MLRLLLKAASNPRPEEALSSLPASPAVAAPVPTESKQSAPGSLPSSAQRATKVAAEAFAEKKHVLKCSFPISF